MDTELFSCDMECICSVAGVESDNSSVALGSVGSRVTRLEDPIRRR